MISVSRANCAEDFEIAADFCRAFGAWDAAEAQAYGVSPETVLALFHSDTSDSLVEKYSSADATMVLARWQSAPAGCIAFGPFDATTAEIQKFYVDPTFRGKGIGDALMRTILSEVAKGRWNRLVLRTTVYMKNAIAVYESFGFTRCPPFRPIPQSIRHTEVFMSRPI
ncbi:GNAT family N-acetyltransferase [Rhizobium ruizarguesonis]|uniref:GNAT family N-acetyltransferase n=1 Tax=Rhizobium ruizarguesonis TaxID=2081791 RepID=UPI00103107E2|nr:GNAT family N-acetyltransferase [Rhizobium ruizarguesonis]TAY73445.1 N-acetyltransferase [Rhizobium ruizarguesonis]